MFTERADVHLDADGNMTFAPQICGIMQIDDSGLISRWADYFDASDMLGHFSDSN